MAQQETDAKTDFPARTADLIERLRRDRVAPGIAVGEPAPPFELVDAHGAAVALADRLGDGPVVLSFYREPARPGDVRAGPRGHRPRPPRRSRLSAADGDR